MFFIVNLILANCEKFAVDVAIEIVIIYERFYEIYGDILAANNCFDIKAYEMGKIYLYIHVHVCTQVCPKIHSN